jgi:hypothetical protein
MKITEVGHILGLLYATVKVKYYFCQKWDRLQFGHFFTNSSGHPACKLKCLFICPANGSLTWRHGLASTSETEDHWFKSHEGVAFSEKRWQCCFANLNSDVHRYNLCKCINRKHTYISHKLMYNYKKYGVCT